MVSLHAAIAVLALSGTGQTAMLDFYADWCAPCKAMNPTVQALIDKGYPVYRVNIDKNKALASQFKIKTIPCFVMVVDGREVDRVTGGTTMSRLERMCKLSKPSSTKPDQPPAMLAQNKAAAPPSAIPLPSAMAAPFDGWGSQQQQQQPSPSEGVSDATLLAATVRIRVADADGHSCGSGTIIDSRGNEALILTCGHIFRDSKGKGRIEVDLFGPNGSQRVAGRLISYDSEVRDVGLVAIQSAGPIATARVAPPGYRLARGTPVASVGCNNGDAPTVRRSQITSLDKFTGPPNIQVAGQPVEGRSGGGLFSNEGYVIGVCNAADPSDKEGLFAAIGSIHAELDRSQLAFVYKASGDHPAAAPEAATAASAALAASALPTMPQQMPGTAELGSLGALPGYAGETPVKLATHEQAALEEIRRSKKEGSEVIIIVRPRNNSNARSTVFELDRASSDFIRQLSAEAPRADKPYQETSLEQPAQRVTLLEWSAEKGTIVDHVKSQAGALANQ